MVKYTSMPERTMVRPKRHWRHELLALAPVMALAVAVVVTFRKDVARLRPPISGGDAGKATVTKLSDGSTKISDGSICTTCTDGVCTTGACNPK